MASAPSYDSKDPPAYSAGPSTGQPGTYPLPGQPFNSPANPQSSAHQQQHLPYPIPPTFDAVYYPQAQPAPYGAPQAQTSVVYINAPGSSAVNVQPARFESYVGHLAFSCLVFWCCNPLFGLTAFILAIVADNTKHKDISGARRLGKASLGLSIGGIIVTVIIVAIVIGVCVGSPDSCSRCYYVVYGVCYSHRRYVGYFCFNCCSHAKDVYYNEYCYSY